MLEKIGGEYEKTARQFIGYFFVGGIAFLFDFSSLFLLTKYLSIHYLTAAAIAFIIGLNVNYFLAKFWVFKTSKIKSLRKEYLSVFLVSLSGLLLNQGIIWVGTELAGLYFLFSKLIAAAIIFIYNFLIRKLFIFD